MSATGPSAGLRVRIVGTGLIGTSLGMALSRKGFQVSLDDPSPAAAALARDLGAGVLAADTTVVPDVVVVAAPPDVVADVVAAELSRWPNAVVTDAASVKGAVLTALQDRGVNLSQYVGSHPMAGREQSGAKAAQGDLFEGRSWVVAPGPQASTGATTQERPSKRSPCAAFAPDCSRPAMGCDPTYCERSTPLSCNAVSTAPLTLAASVTPAFGHRDSSAATTSATTSGGAATTTTSGTTVVSAARTPAPRSRARAAAAGDGSSSDT